MKKLMFLLLIFLAEDSYSQHYKLNTRYPGYFINVKGDTIRGYILLSNKLDNQRGAIYSNDAQGQKVVIHLLADRVKGFKVQDRVYTAMRHGEPDPGAEHFVLTLAEGERNLYVYFSFPNEMYISSGGGQRPVTGDDEQYLQKEYLIADKKGNKFILNNANEFFKNAELIFAGHAEIIAKIKARQRGYRFSDLEQIVKKFNQQK